MSAPAAGWLARQLPVVMQQDDFTRRFLAVFEEVADTLVHSVESAALVADPTVTPAPLLPWLGSWIAGPVDPGGGSGSLRERDWLQAQSRALGARGTRAGLRCWLGLLSGGRPVEITDGGGVHREGETPADEIGWVRVTMPLGEGVDARQVLDLIREEVPIGVAVELVVLPSGPSPIPGPRAAPEDEGPPPAPAGEDQPLSGGVRRLPGTAGRAVPPGRLCPSCAEPNVFEAVTCLRCGSILRVPRPAPEPEPELVVDPLWDDEDRPAEPRIWPVVAVVVGLLLIMNLLLLVGYLLS
jgi:phage tail-like protein